MMKIGTVVEFPINTCRLCTKVKDDVVDVVSDKVLTKSIWLLLYIKITKNDILPRTVCKCCRETVFMWNIFKENSLRNNKKLLKIFQQKIISLDHEYTALNSKIVNPNNASNTKILVIASSPESNMDGQLKTMDVTHDHCSKFANEGETLQNNTNTNLVITQDLSIEFSSDAVIKNQPVDKNGIDEILYIKEEIIDEDMAEDDHYAHSDNGSIEPSDAISMGFEICIKEEDINEDMPDDSHGDDTSVEPSEGIDIIDINEIYIKEENINEDMAVDDECMIDVPYNANQYQTVSDEALNVLENDATVSSETVEKNFRKISTHFVNEEINNVTGSVKLIDNDTSESNSLQTNESMENTYVGSKRKFLSNPVKKIEPVKDLEPNIQSRYTCPLCREMYRNVSLQYIEKHMSEHNVQLKLVCRHCLDVFVSAEELKEHMKEYHPSIRQTSSNSGLNVINQLELKFQRHLMIYKLQNSPPSTVPSFSTPKTLPCSLCGKDLHSEEELKIHTEVVHSNGKIYNCPKCSRDIPFTNKEFLLEHMNMEIQSIIKMFRTVVKQSTGYELNNEEINETRICASQPHIREIKSVEDLSEQNKKTHVKFRDEYEHNGLHKKMKI